MERSRPGSRKAASSTVQTRCAFQEIKRSCAGRMPLHGSRFLMILISMMITGPVFGLTLGRAWASANARRGVYRNHTEIELQLRGEVQRSAWAAHTARLQLRVRLLNSRSRGGGERVVYPRLRVPVYWRPRGLPLFRRKGSRSSDVLGGMCIYTDDEIKHGKR